MSMHTLAATTPTRLAWRVRRAVTLAGEKAARGKDLLRPLRSLDDAVIVACGDRIERVETFSAFRPEAGMRVRDLGAVTVIPAVVNAHTHLQLSHLAGRTTWGQGFVPWLRSLIPLLALPPEPAAVEAAIRRMADDGTAHVGDYTGQGAVLVGEMAGRTGVGCTLFCEWFGFSTASFSAPDDPWPTRYGALLRGAPEDLRRDMTPAGHALYSTHPGILRAAHAWCVEHARPFSLHLAEFTEETEALVSGRGALADLYAGVVLPENWKAPGLPPVPLAEKLGLLGPGTLAVHCVQCSDHDIHLLARSGAAVCLCPRSNAALAVGRPPARKLLEAGVLLCLGTDGLSSNTDLDVRREAVALRELGLPGRALVRMLTINGAAALGRDDLGTLEPGKLCRWAVLPEELWNWK